MTDAPQGVNSAMLASMDQASNKSSGAMAASGHQGTATTVGGDASGMIPQGNVDQNVASPGIALMPRSSGVLDENILDGFEGNMGPFNTLGSDLELHGHAERLSAAKGFGVSANTNLSDGASFGNIHNITSR